MEYFTLADELTTRSASELVALIRARDVSPVEIVEAHLRRIEELNPSLNAIVTFAPDALDRAHAAKTSLKRGEQISALHGLPITIKDTIDTAGLRTTSGSRLRAHHVANSDASVVARLKAAGAIILGKTNTPEMAAYYECVNPVFGRTSNPHDLSRSSGGSSGGEAAAIAACLSPAGIGSDLSGSIRLPAHFCGIAGLKPTMGVVPIDGHTPHMTGALSLGGTIGPMARTVGDLALLLDVIADKQQLQTEHDLRGLRAVWYVDDGVAPIDNEVADAVRRSVQALGEAGLQIEQTTPPGVEYGMRLWIELFSSSFLKQLREFYLGREGEAGKEVAIMLSKIEVHNANMETKIAAAERQAKAVLEREKLREDLLRWMNRTPIIIAPVGATCAFEHGGHRVDVNGESISVFRAFSYSQTYNVFGLPSVAVPVGRNREGLPIGVQVIGAPVAERTILAAARIIENAFGGWQPVDESKSAE